MAALFLANSALNTTATNDRRAYIRRRSVEVAVRDGALAHVRCINTYPKSLMQGSLLRAATIGPGNPLPPIL